MWFGQLCLHSKIRENISTITENIKNKIRVQSIVMTRKNHKITKLNYAHNTDKIPYKTFNISNSYIHAYTKYLL